MTTEPLKNLAKALVNAQKEMTALVKDAKNPHYQSKYASLAAVNDSCLPALNSAGIAVIQGAHTEENNGRVWVGVTTTFLHGDTGESWTEELKMKPVKDDPQGIGSCITYARRYLLMAMAGLAPDDDDGNEASGTAQKAQQQAPQRPQTAHRAQPAPQPRKPAPVNGDHVNAGGLEEESNFYPNERNPFLDEAPAPNGEMPGLLQDFIADLRDLERVNSDKASEKQHQYAVSIIDGITGKDTHRAVFQTILGREVTADQPLTIAAAQLIFKYLAEQSSTKQGDKWVKGKNPNYNPALVQHIKAAYSNPIPA